MKLFAPKYYREFKCIADKCTHSCCIGWEIDIDDNTLKKYESLKEGYGKEIINTVIKGETSQFKLCENERCPHLDNKGLCKIISEVGEEYLCDICREHPRFYNDTARGKFVGLGMACGEAARIILESDYTSFVGIGEKEGEEKKFDAVSMMEIVYDILSDNDFSYNEKISLIEKSFKVTPEILSDEAWREVIDSLEYLDETHRELFLKYTSDISAEKSMEKIFERALAYFVYRHCLDAYDEEEFLVSLGFSLFLVNLLVSIIDENSEIEDIVRLARIVSEEIEYSQENIDTIKFEIMD